MLQEWLPFRLPNRRHRRRPRDFIALLIFPLATARNLRHSQGVRPRPPAEIVSMRSFVSFSGDFTCNRARSRARSCTLGNTPHNVRLPAQNQFGGAMIPPESAENRGTAANRVRAEVANYIVDLKSHQHAATANNLLIASCANVVSLTQSANGPRPRSAAMAPTREECREVVSPTPRVTTSRLTSEVANWVSLGATRDRKRDCA